MLTAYREGGSWPSPSPQAFLQLPLLQVAVNNFRDDLPKLQRIWMSKLFPGGCAVLRQRDMLQESIFWVCGSCIQGAFVWRGTRILVDDSTYIRLDDDDQALTTMHMIDPAEWLVLDLSPVLPHELAAKFGNEPVPARLQGCTMKVSQAPVPLLTHCARRAFEGLTVALMKDLAIFLKSVKGRMPTLEADLVRLLVTSVLTTEDPSEIDRICKLRYKKKKKSMAFETAINPSNMEDVAEAIEAADLPVVMKEAEKNAADARARSSGSSSRPGSASHVALGPGLGHPDSLPPAEPASSSSRAPARHAPAFREPRPVIGDEITPEEARMLIPSVTGCNIATHTGRAWIVKYLQRVTSGPKSHHRTWGGDLSHKEALIQCVIWAWDRHVEAGGEACPWQLTDL